MVVYITSAEKHVSIEISEMNLLKEFQKMMSGPFLLVEELRITKSRSNMMTRTKHGMSITPIFCLKNLFINSTAVVGDLCLNGVM